MKTYSTLAQATSRILAVLIMALPLAYLSSYVAKAERDLIPKLDHQELLAYLREGYTQSVGEEFLFVLLTLAISVAVIEATALAIRWVFGLLTADALTDRPGLTPSREAAVANMCAEWEKASGKSGNRSGVLVR